MENNVRKREPWMNWNPKFRDPDEETLRKLRASRAAYEKAERRQIRCPICHARLVGVQAERRGFVEIKCQTCKFAGVLDLRLFRRQKTGGYSGGKR